MGGNNLTQLKITESIGANKIKVIPDVLITGGNDSPNGPISGLLGLELMKELAKKVGKEEHATVENAPGDKKTEAENKG